MNKQLLDPFESDYPERIEEELQYGSLHARCCAFNRRGTLLATGCHEGAAVLWDFDTRGVVKVLKVQEKDSGEPASPVVALGWSLNGRRVVTAEEKGRIRLWNVESGAVVYSTLLESISLTVQISPGDPNLILACPNNGVPVLIDVASGKTRSLTASHTAETSAATATARKQGNEVLRNYSACFTNDGARVYVGNGKGLVSLWEVASLEQCGSFQLPTATAVRNIQVSCTLQLLLERKRHTCMHRHTQRHLHKHTNTRKTNMHLQTHDMCDTRRVDGQQQHQQEVVGLIQKS